MRTGWSLLALLLAAASVHAQDAATDGSVGSAGTAPDESHPLPAADADRLAAMDARIQLLDKQTAVLTSQAALEKEKLEVITAKWPVATVDPKQKADASGFENLGFLADWALSANVGALLPNLKGLKEKCGGRATVVSDDPAFAAKLGAARAFESAIDALSSQATQWLADADRATPVKHATGSSEASVAAGMAIARSLVTQTLSLMQYFQTSIDIQPAQASVPTLPLRARLAAHCGDGRLPELASPADGALAKKLVALGVLADTLRARTTGDAAKGLPAGLVARGTALVAGIAAIETQANASKDGGPSFLAQAAQLLANGDATALLMVSATDAGGAVYKRTNLFFLSPRLSAIAAATVDYTLTEMATGKVLWSAHRQVRTQVNQKMNRWDADAPAVADDAADAAMSTTVID